MPHTFSKFGISFLYPDNWTLDEQDAEDEAQSATVYSPGGAFWSVSVHSPSSDPEGLAEAAVEAMQVEYPELEQEPTYEVVDTQKVHGFDLNFYFLDLTNSAFVRSFRTPVATYVVFYQAEDREFRQLEQVFAAITKTLFDSLD
jgi:hypothetical protein